MLDLVVIDYRQVLVQPSPIKGVGTAMTVAALVGGLELGTPVAVLRAASAGLGIYRSLGFQEYGRYGRYVWRHESGGE